MSFSQEQVMRHMHDFSISLAESKTFVLHSSAESFNLIHDQIKELHDLYRKLDDVLPDDSDEDVTVLPVYLEKVGFIVQLFQELYEAEISDEQYAFVAATLICG